MLMSVTYGLSVSTRKHVRILHVLSYCTKAYRVLPHGILRGATGRGSPAQLIVAICFSTLHVGARDFLVKFDGACPTSTFTEGQHSTLTKGYLYVVF